MTRVLLVATLLLAAPLAAAQNTPSRIWPLAPGNTWTYLKSGSYYSNNGGGGNNPVQAETWTVLDSVETDAGRLPRVRFADTECLVETMQAGDVTSFRLLAVSGNAPCARGAVPTMNGIDFSVVLTASDPSTISVGGESVTVPRTRSGGQDDGVASDVTYQIGDGLGVTRASGRYHTFGSGQYRFETTVLRHATIGGQTVGQTLETRPDFWPLAVGNRWEFRITDPPGTSLGEVAWTVEAAGNGLALRMQHVQNGAVVSSATCPVSVGEASLATAWQTLFSLSGCSLADTALAPNLNGAPVALGIDLYSVAQSSPVGTQTVTADVASGANTLGGGPNGYAAETYYALARDIGPVSYSTYRRTPYTLRNAVLAFARVGGTTYGQQVVADEAGPDVAALALAAGPNPTRGALALSFALPAPADAAVEVVDALGRTVLHHDLGARTAGAGTARLDLSGLAAGVYSVRLTAGALQTGVRVSVVR